MKRVVLLIILLVVSVNAQMKKDYPIQPVPFTKVHVTEGFWFDRMETNRTVTIPYSIKLLEETGRMKNFEIAAKRATGDFCSPYYFDDSDAYKVIEAASYSLMLKPDAELSAKLDKMIEVIGAAQEQDGYLYTPRTIGTKKFEKVTGDKRWLNEEGSHELYTVGHMYEAAVAHYLATGKKNFLDIALKSAELVNSVFGPGKLQLPTGHQEIEIGLVKLYRLTGEEKYLKLAKFFLDMRGNYAYGRKSWGEYNQDHKPVVKQDEAVGHAVRAAYMYSGMADVAALTGDKSYINALDKIWNNVVSKKIYLTGGIGASGSWEGFGPNYELPNASAYNETCASIANVMWNHRMFLQKGDSKYLDILERTLYNALLSGIGMSGDLFFYPNVLESFGTHERAKWFSCACCPPNVARLIASIGNYIYASKENQIYANLYTSNKSEIMLKDGLVTLQQETTYPWSGNIKITVTPQSENQNFTLKLRIPGWAQNKAMPSELYTFADYQKEKVFLTVNGKLTPLNLDKGFASIKRNWNAGDVVELTLPMEIRRIAANEKVEADRGRLAIQRGPLVYATEWKDNKDGFVRNILLPENASLSSKFEKDLLNGVQTINGKAFGYKADDKNNLVETEQDFVAIPYYAWAHRGKGEMSVWIAKEESAVRPLAGKSLLTDAKITASHGRNPEIIRDQMQPKNSNDHSLPYFHWWPSKGENEWIQIDFENPTEVSSVSAYWFDDSGEGECRVPESWKVFYMEEAGKWRAVYPTIEKPYGVAKDKYNSVEFETVKTKAVKIEIQSQKDFAGGLHEIILK
ncbi:MAG: glycoside hydrolase family 127 protein [Ignavibacteria bacterium]|nr:glycoside hydrolase family 127 protein [Ignavibacteria bacterium]